MAITLNHTIVPSHNHVTSAQFYTRIFNFDYEQDWGPFAIVRVNDSLTLDFMEKEKFSSNHYAFKVSEEEFDAILQRIKTEQCGFGSGPMSVKNGEINHAYGGRGVYFPDPNGHILEIITQDYDLS
ncbi:MAG: VOC family protein [Bermanella sp.]